MTYHYRPSYLLDIDTVIYTLGNEVNPDTGWGLRDEGWRAMDMVAMYGGIDWFRLETEILERIYFERRDFRGSYPFRGHS